MRVQPFELNMCGFTHTLESPKSTSCLSVSKALNLTSFVAKLGVLHGLSLRWSSGYSGRLYEVDALSLVEPGFRHHFPQTSLGCF